MRLKRILALPLILTAVAVIFSFSGCDATSSVENICSEISELNDLSIEKEGNSNKTSTPPTKTKHENNPITTPSGVIEQPTQENPNEKPNNEPTPQPESPSADEPTPQSNVLDENPTEEDNVLDEDPIEETPESSSEETPQPETPSGNENVGNEEPQTPPEDKGEDKQEDKDPTEESTPVVEEKPIFQFSLLDKRSCVNYDFENNVITASLENAGWLAFHFDFTKDGKTVAEKYFVYEFSDCSYIADCDKTIYSTMYFALTKIGTTILTITETASNTSISLTINII